MHSHPAYVIYVIAGGKFRNHSADVRSLKRSSEPATLYIVIRSRTGPRTLQYNNPP